MIAGTRESRRLPPIPHCRRSILRVVVAPIWAVLAALAAVSLPAADAAATHLDGFVFDFTPDPQVDLTQYFSHDPADSDPNAAIIESIVGATGYSGGEMLFGYQQETLTFLAMDAVECVPTCANATLYVAFDLILFGDMWTGNDPESLFTLAQTGNGDFVWNATFANVPTSSQSFPGSYPSGSFPAHTGQLVGFAYNWSAYRIELTMPAISLGPDVDAYFEMSASFASDPVDAFDASWGIDNFVVSSTPIPEPGTASLVLLGLAALAARRGAPTGT